MSNRSVFCKFFSVCSPQKQNLPRGYCAHPFPSFAESKSSRIPYVHRFVWQVLRGAFSQKNISYSCFPERRIVQRVVLLVEYLAQTHLPKDKACRDGTVRIHNINRQRVPATAQLQRSRKRAVLVEIFLCFAVLIQRTARIITVVFRCRRFRYCFSLLWCIGGKFFRFGDRFFKGDAVI